VRATRIAARVGQLFAMVGGVAALVYQQPMLILIAVFVFFTAAQEAAMVETSAVGKGIIIDQMMITRYVTVAAHASLRDAVQLLLDGEQGEFPVVGFSGAVEGLLTRDNLTRGLATRGPDSMVRESMTQPVPLLPLGLDFDTALRQLRGSGLPALPVVDANQQLVGLLTLANVTDLILIRQAVAKA
jgi:CBS domain-containing protein